ncbi:MAG: glycosyltransferase family 8 protein [Opitutae bacterium]
MSEKIPIVFCFNAGFVNYAAVSTFSAFVNSRANLKVYWIIPNHSVSIVTPIKEILTSKGIDVTIKDVSDDCFREWKEVGHFSLACYLRLIIPEVIPEPKVIYLDGDLIVQSDLSQLFKVEMGNNSIGGVYDEDGEKTSSITKIKNGQYINSGVLILNLDELRNNQFFQRCTEIYNKYRNEITWADQCIINKYTEGRKILISPNWNFRFSIEKNLQIPASDIISKYKASNIVHFIGVIKPWSINCPTHLGDFWWGYANQLNLPNLSRKPYNSMIIKRVFQSINYRLGSFKQFIKKLFKGQPK